MLLPLMVEDSVSLAWLNKVPLIVLFFGDEGSHKLDITPMSRMQIAQAQDGHFHTLGPSLANSRTFCNDLSTSALYFLYSFLPLFLPLLEPTQALNLAMTVSRTQKSRVRRYFSPECWELKSEFRYG